MPEPATPSLPSSPLAARLVMLAIGIGWGSGQLLTKLATSTGHHPLGLGFWQAAIATACFSTVLLATRRRLPLRRGDIVFYLVCGLAGTALPAGLTYSAIRHIPVGLYSIILSTVPIMTLFLSLLIGIERPDLRRGLGVLAGLAGVLVIVAPRAALPQAGEAIWVVAVLAVSLSYSIENIYIARAKPVGIDSLQIMCGLSWGGLLLIAPAVWLSDGWLVADRLGLAEWALIGTSLVHVCAYLGFVWLIGAAGPVFASQVGYLVTGAGVVVGMLVLGERHPASVWAALALICIGIALVSPRARR